MHLEPDSPHRADEQRRYFPDWTRRLLAHREELEADHNSYLAGGYAEEFGYFARAGSSRGVPLLDGEPPEQSAEWFGEAAAMHPGYPITPTPLALELEPSVARDTGHRRIVSLSEGSREVDRRREFVRVTDRPYERERHDVAHRATAVVTRLLSALVALRWDLAHKRRAQ